MALPMTGEILWEITTPLGFRVRVARHYWEVIITMKHPVMAGREAEVQAALASPDEIRQSKTDAAVLLFYKRIGARRWICAVARRLNGDGFLITTYPTDVMKEGERIWPK
jgi:hypothetical protein